MKNTFKSIIALLIAIVIYSCTQDDAVMPANQEKVNLLQGKANFEMDCTFTTENPYAYVGELHNEILSVSLQEYPNGIQDLSELTSVVDQIAKNNPRFMELVGAEEVSTNPETLVAGIEDFENNFHGTIDRLDISDEAKNQLKELVDYMFSKGLQKQEPSYEEIDNTLASMELSVLNTEFYKEEERQVLLSALATARSSSCFWNGYFSKTLNKTDDDRPRRRWWQWLIIGVADVGGAIAGAGAGPATAVTTGASASVAAHTITNPSTK